MINIVAFYTFAFLALLFTILIIASNRIIYSILSAVAVFLSIAGLYFLLNSPFNAVAQIAIYGIGVTILLLFAIMLVSYQKDTQIYLAFKPRTLFAALGLGLIILSVFMLLYDDFHEFLMHLDYTVNANLTNVIDTTSAIGTGIFQNYILAFELLSIFLLVALIGVGIVFLRPRSEDK